MALAVVALAVVALGVVTAAAAEVSGGCAATTTVAIASTAKRQVLERCPRAQRTHLFGGAAGSGRGGGGVRGVCECVDARECEVVRWGVRPQRTVLRAHHIRSLGQSEERSGGAAVGGSGVLRDAATHALQTRRHGNALNARVGGSVVGGASGWALAFGRKGVGLCGRRHAVEWREVTRSSGGHHQHRGWRAVTIVTAVSGAVGGSAGSRRSGSGGGDGDGGDGLGVGADAGVARAGPHVQHTNERAGTHHNQTAATPRRALCR